MMREITDLRYQRYKMGHPYRVINEVRRRVLSGPSMISCGEY
jgi:hypothetical protein